MTSEIVVIGGGYAGLIAALRMARAAKKHGAHVTLISPTPELVERIRLHQWAVGQTPPRRPFLPLLERAGVEFLAGSVTRIDRERHVLDVTRTSGEVVHRSFNTCVYAPGSFVDTSRVPGAQNAFTLDRKCIPRLLSALRARPAQNIVVVGGGLTGIEAAAEIAEQFPHHNVYLLCAGRVAEELSMATRDDVQKAFRELGVHVTEHASIAHVHSDHLELDDGRRVPHDVCIWAAGMRAPSLAKDSGFTTDAAGRMVVDGALRSVDDPAVVGAGDAVLATSSGKCAAMMGCKVAMPMGAHAGDVVTDLLEGRPARPFSFVSAGFCVSLGRKRGLVERADRDGNLDGKPITGWLGVLIKELICRFTWWALVVESRRPGTYAWFKLREARSALPPAAATEHGHTAP